MSLEQVDVTVVDWSRSRMEDGVVVVDHDEEEPELVPELDVSRNLLTVVDETGTRRRHQKCRNRDNVHQQSNVFLAIC